MHRHNGNDITGALSAGLGLPFLQSDEVVAIDLLNVSFIVHAWEKQNRSVKQNGQVIQIPNSIKFLHDSLQRLGKRELAKKIAVHYKKCWDFIGIIQTWDKYTTEFELGQHNAAFFIAVGHLLEDLQQAIWVDQIEARFRLYLDEFEVGRVGAIAISIRNFDIGDT